MRSRSSLLGILFVAVVMSACDQNTSDSQVLDLKPDGISALEAPPTPATQDGSNTQLAGAPTDGPLSGKTDTPSAESKIPSAAKVEIRRADNSDRDPYYDAIRRAEAR